MRLLPLLAALLTLVAAGCGEGHSSQSKILFLSDRDGGWALYAMSANGGAAQRVLEGGHADPSAEGIGIGDPVVSPDGRKVLLARRGITVGTLATGTLKRIGAGEEAGAGWSPDSTRIAFGGTQDEGLYVADVRTGRTHYVDSSSQVWGPAWSADGKWIAFEGQGNTYVVHPGGGGLREVSSHAPSNQGGYAWSRDGKLAFVDGRLYVVDEGTWRAHALRSRVGQGSVSWTPDGHTLAYAAATGSSNPFVIFTIGADGRRLRRLTPTWPPASEDSPVWSHDGKSLLFVRTPVGGGATTEMPQVWSMRADGSQRHRLTTAFPDGGDNLEPAWASGPLHPDPMPQPQEVRAGDKTVLRVPFAVDGIAAERGVAAVAPLGYEETSESRPTPPVLLWRPGRGQPSRLVASPCGGVGELVLSAGRVAFDCDHQFFDESLQQMWVADVKTRIPREVFVGHGMFFGGPGPSQGIFLDSIVGGAGLLAFGSETDKPGHRERLTLWRVDGFFGVAIRAGTDAGNVAAAGGGHLATELRNGDVAILNRDGRQVRVLALPSKRPQLALAGPSLLALVGRSLRAYDTSSGRLRWQRRAPTGAELQAADGRFTVYTVGSTIHVVSPRGERVIRTGARVPRSLHYYTQQPLYVALAPGGLYYCFNVADARYPGRVVYMPME